MAKGLREIKNRIRSVTNTGQITRAMQLVASSKMKRAQDAALAGRPYAILLSRFLATALRNNGISSADLSHPLLSTREIKTRGVVVISTNKGLCGGLNSNLFRFLNREISADANVKYITIGKKAAQFIARSHKELLADFAVSDHVNFSEVRTIGDFLLKQYLSGKIDSIELVLSQFKNTIVQVPIHTKIVPIIDIEKSLKKQFEIHGDGDFSLLEDNREMQFEPSANEILNGLPALFFKQSLYQAILEAKASEQSARMVAMKSATDNAKSLVDSLSLEYNKARQAAITNEINDLGAAARAASEN